MKIIVRRDRPKAPAQKPQVCPRRAVSPETLFRSSFTTKEILRELRECGRPRSYDGRRRGNQYTKSSPRLHGGETRSSGLERAAKARPWCPYRDGGMVRRYREEG